jgi:putative nucleotidyltransferase with HDIG domain
MISFVLIFSLLLFALFFFYRSSWETVLGENEVIPLSLLFVLLIILVDKFPIKYYSSRNQGGAEITVSFALNFTVAFIFSPFQALVISFIGSTLADILDRKEPHKIIFNASMIGTATGITSLIFRNFYNLGSSLTNIHNLLILIFASVFYILFETVILFGLLSTLTGANFVRFWRYNMKKISLALLSLFPLGIIMIYFFTTNIWMNLFLLPTFVAIYFALRREKEIQDETTETLAFLASVVDNKIPDTFDHSKRVAYYVETICHKLKLEEEDVSVIIEAARMHDIGKIAIPENILFKRGKLTKEEYNIIKEHAIEGEQIVNKLSQFRRGATIIRHHHERFDGTGYPDNLKGNDIPLGSRIIAIADAFDAMTTFRLYSTPRTIEDALHEVEVNKGTQFDPEIADVFIQIVRENYEEIKSSITDLSREIS